MHNLDVKHPNWPGFKHIVPLSCEPQPDRMNHRGRPPGLREDTVSHSTLLKCHGPGSSEKSGRL